MERMHELIEFGAQLVELLAVVIVLVLILVGTTKWILSGTHLAQGYERYRLIIGKSLLVGLELLIAADIIRTVAVTPTLPGIGNLGLLVLIRTFLAWTVTLEIEGRWPWQAAKECSAEAAAEPPRAAPG